MQPRMSFCNPVLYIVAALLVFGMFVLRAALNLSFTTSMLIMVVVIVVLWGGLLVLVQMRLGWLRRVNRVMLRLQRGDAAAVIAETNDRRAQGDRSFETAIALSLAYGYQGDGSQAEEYAREALEDLEAHQVCEQPGTFPRLRCDMAVGALCDAWITQGRFEQAARRLHTHLPRTLQPRHMSLVVVWSLFLGGKDDEARERLTSTQPLDIRLSKGERVSPQYLLMLTYMRHKLLGEAFRPDLRAGYRDQLAVWEDEVARNAHNPYGVRLRAVLDEVRAWLEETSDTENGV